MTQKGYTKLEQEEVDIFFVKKELDILSAPLHLIPESTKFLEILLSDLKWCSKTE